MKNMNKAKYLYQIFMLYEICPAFIPTWEKNRRDQQNRRLLMCFISKALTNIHSWNSLDYWKWNGNSHSDVFWKKGVLRNFVKFTGKHMYKNLFFNNFTKKETLAQVFSCQFCKICKNTFCYKTPPVVASDETNKTF